ncbi:MAG TPA: DinB family protein [Candidatus Bathyarchaeia archaeon]|nr:DinB family protein [Candidatus Bathyarchaeia archaeon]
MELELIRGIWGYHWWSNRTLFGEVAALGADGAKKDMGKHWSFPTLKGMLAHIYGADRIWLERWKGGTPTKLHGDADFQGLPDLRTAWDALESEQRAFVGSLGTAELARTLDYKSTEGKPFAQPLWQLLQHVVNHATHHRSEIAAMLTMAKGSPPSTDMVLFYRQPKP